MDATRRLAERSRQFHPAGRIPVLLLLRSAIGLLLLIAVAAGAVTPDSPTVGDDIALLAATTKPASRIPEAPAAPAPARRKRSVFVCDDAGTPVYSDRPCGPDLVQRSISVDSPGPGRVASTAPPVPMASTRPRMRDTARSDVADKTDERCATLRRQLDELDDHMRTGYSSREAVKLWDRRRNLKDYLRSTGC
jgi:hypothetical protein